MQTNATQKRGRPRSPSVVYPMPALGSKIRYTVPEAAHLLGISVSLAYERIASGHLSTTSDGRRRYITDAEVRRYGGESH